MHGAVPASSLPSILALAMAMGCAADPPPGSHGDAGADQATTGDEDLDAAPLVGTVTLPLASGRNIAAFAYGQNYWNWEPDWGAAVAGTAPLVKAAGVKLIRAGGANNEIQTPNQFTNAELDKFAAYCKTAGAEPVLQVSLIKNAAGQPATALDAADMVTYANVTMAYGIRYWSIGNEPDLYTSQSLKAADYAAADYCATFKDYAAAMRAVDPTIKILGPELSWKYISGNDWLTPFLDGCKDVVDIVAVHRYPFAPDKPTKEAAFVDAANFRQVVRALRANLDQHGMQAIPLAITEEHITYDGDPAKSTLSASPQTFFAGLWAADVLGVAMEEGLWTGAFWHIADSTTGWKLAFILGTTPMPTYQATSLLATHFTGKILTPGGVPSGFSVYASRDDSAGTTSVVVLNKTATAARLAFTFDNLPAQNLGFPSESLTLAVFADAGAAPRVFRYTNALADASLPPVAE